MLCLLITMLNKEESPCAVLANYNVKQGRVNVLCLLITMLDKEESPCAVLANYNVRQGRQGRVTMCCAC